MDCGKVVVLERERLERGIERVGQRFESGFDAGDHEVGVVAVALLGAVGLHAAQRQGQQ